VAGDVPCETGSTHSSCLPCSAICFCCAVVCCDVLMQAEAANPACHLVLVENPAEVLDELEGHGDAQQVGKPSGTACR
jgi:hypothetical protein